MQINDCKRVRRLHLVGIGGAGMSGIAEVLHENGFVVTGSDMGEGAVIDYLKHLGIRVDNKHEAKNVAEADLVVYSSAIPYDNPELVEARARRIPVIRRAEMLGAPLSLAKFGKRPAWTPLLSWAEWSRAREAEPRWVRAITLLPKATNLTEVSFP